MNTNVLSRLASQCKEDEPEVVNQEGLLPSATQTGEHTLGCLINRQAQMYAVSTGTSVAIKKIMGRLKISSLLLAISLLCISCWEDVPEGLSTTITGQVIDSIKNKSIEGANVLLIACHPNFYNSGCSNVIDSARTDSEGRFGLSFVTSGKASAYMIGVEENHNVIFTSTDTVIAGQLNEIQLYARELNVLKVELRIAANPVGPIRLITPGGTRNTINQATRDTIVYGRVIPLRTNWITFDVFDHELDQIDNRRKDTDTIEVDLSDTVVYTKKIADPKEWSTN